MRRSFSQARTLVCTTSIVTQLVFEHALRIRVKAEISFPPTAILESRSEATTPGSGSAVDISVVSEDAGRGRQENPSEQSTSTTTGTNGKRKEEAPRSDSGMDGNEECASNNLVGKMNNLVSTDLENLVTGRDILLLCLSSLPLRHPALPSLLTFIFSIVIYFPLQVATCVWFLYRILGWSAFIGVATMVALFPIPGVVADKIREVQKETMKRVSSCPFNTLTSGFTSRSDGCACAGCY